MKYGVLKYEKIRSLRIDNNLTQREIAQILNVRQNTYARYELGDRGIPIEVFIILARFYDVSVDYLLGLTDDKKPHLRKE